MTVPTTGRFVWHELHTHDRGRALTFYCRLLGWTIREVPLSTGEPYGLCFLGGRDHAGIIRSRAPAGTPPRWLPYLAVNDVDAAAESAQQLGGRLLGAPADIPNVGRIAVLADPQGAVFAVHKHVGPHPVEPASPPLGAFCWEDLVSSDPAAAARFYASLFGFAAEPVPLGGAGAYWLLRRGSRDTAGILPLSGESESSGSHWLAYLHVKDLERAVRNAREIGATQLAPPRDVAGVGRFVVLQDPTGAAFALFHRAAV